ncbi:Ig domain-containing protein, partial [Ectothiorhodospira lacustris]|uniref:Ig domain-containing protein n=1 Tax=Ectothiorhodospira lacustris TaxID=2899127 RepID=UPI001EE82481
MTIGRKYLICLLLLIPLFIAGCGGGDDGGGFTNPPENGADSGENRPERPLEFTGQGNDVLPFQIQTGGAVFFDMTHNGSGVFFVTLLDQNANRIRSLLIESGNVSARAVENLAAGNYLLEIEAGGSWVIRITRPSTPQPDPDPTQPVEPVSIATDTLNNGLRGNDYAEVLRATGGTQSYSWSIEEGSRLPERLSLNSTTGGISGIPTRSGVFNFNVRVTDSRGEYYIKALSIAVDAPQAPQILTDQLPNAVVDQDYIALLQADGGETPYEWSAVAGINLDAIGLSLSSEGILSGIPTRAGSYRFVVRVSSSNGASSFREVNLSVTVSTAPSINQTSLPAGVVDQSYVAKLNANGGQAPYSWAIEAGTLPPGIEINPANGIISGTPTAAGIFNFVARVTDANQGE